MGKFNERQLEIIEAIASWKPLARGELCTKCSELGSECLPQANALGTLLQKQDLLQGEMRKFAAGCKLNGMFEGESVNLFDMLDELHTASD